MGKWIVQKMPENVPEIMPKVELACGNCGYVVLYEPGFDPFQPVPSGQYGCPFCPGLFLVRHIEPGAGLLTAAQARARQRDEYGLGGITEAEIREAEDQISSETPSQCLGCEWVRAPKGRSAFCIGRNEEELSLCGDLNLHNNCQHATPKGFPDAQDHTQEGDPEEADALAAEESDARSAEEGDAGH